MNLSIPSQSVEYVRATVTSAVDPTAYAVEFAFATPGVDPETFSAGAWEGDAVQTGKLYRATARFLVSGLSEGLHTAWLRVNAAPEAVLRSIGTLKIT